MNLSIKNKKLMENPEGLRDFLRLKIKKILNFQLKIPQFLP